MCILYIEESGLVVCYRLACLALGGRVSNIAARLSGSTSTSS